MKYCTKCGTELNNGVCEKCGPATTVVNNNNLDTGSVGWAFLGFFFPLVGLILYCVWLSTKPLSAKMAGKGALISVIVNVVLTIIALVFYFLLVSKVSTYPSYTNWG